MEERKCVFCNSVLEYYDPHEDYAVGVKCPLCGKYAFSMRDNDKLLKYPKDIVALYMYHNNMLRANERPDEYTLFIGSKSRYEGLKGAHPHYHYVSLEEMKAFYPQRFSDRIDNTLLGIARKSHYFGDTIKIKKEEVHKLFFLTCFDQQGAPIDRERLQLQRSYIISYFKDNHFIDSPDELEYERKITLLAAGWKRIEDIEKSDEDNKDVFVSMSFADELEPIREAIREGIKKAEFSPEFMNEIIHNKEIVPEMFRLIRECRFLIMDITKPNYGAYYEAGYALGLGKEVIITCSKESKDRELTEAEKPFEKYLRPHFDIAQKQILYWDDYDDLTNKLSEWIKALFR